MIFSSLCRSAFHPSSYLHPNSLGAGYNFSLHPSAHTPRTPKFSSCTYTSLCDNTHPLAVGDSGSRTCPCGWLGARCPLLRARWRPRPELGLGPARGARGFRAPPARTVRHQLPSRAPPRTAEVSPADLKTERGKEQNR